MGVISETHIAIQEKINGVEINIKEIFEWGVDYGLLLAEEERRGESYSDAFMGVVGSNKFSMPMNASVPREVRSENWFEAKNKSLTKFVELLIELKKAKS